MSVPSCLRSVESFAHVQAIGIILASAGVGIVAHEASHAVVLWGAGVPCSVTILPDDDRGPLAGALTGALVRIEPDRRPRDLSPWLLRAAALMPLTLAVPFALMVAGVVPDPFSDGSVVAQVALVAWLGCSIPSPQDFSLAWYPERALAGADDGH